MGLIALKYLEIYSLSAFFVAKFDYDAGSA